jgi:DNA-binding IclR family transcriptional regulator
VIAFKLLTKVVEGGEDGYGVTDLAKAVSMHKAKVHRYLRTLEQMNMLYQDPETSRYSIVPGFCSWGEAI